MDRATIERQDTYLDVLVTVEKEMDKGEQAKMIFALPETEERFEMLQKEKRGIKNVVWRRLFSLGYTDKEVLRKKVGPKNRNSPTVAKQYQQAVRKFQLEAGTNPDGWVGLETWESMQELFAFEHDANLEKWFAPQYEKILARAVHLRLMILGLIRKPGGRNRDTGDSDEIREGLYKWRALLKGLDVNEIDNDTDQNTLIEYLFDIDRLTKMVADNFGKLRLLAANPAFNNIMDASELLRFQKSLVKIELWLYGYERIIPGNKGTNYKIRYVKKDNRHNLKNPVALALSEFLDQFSIDVPIELMDDESRLLEIALVQLASLDDEESKNATAQRRSELLVERIDKLTPKQHSQLGKDMKSAPIGDWLFDGIKRVYRWLKSSIIKLFDFVKGAAKKVGMLIQKLACAAKRVASEAYSFVRRGFQVLVDGFTFLAKKQFHAKNHAVAIHKSTDMDTLVFVRHDADQSNIDSFHKMMRRMLIRAKAAMALANLIIEETFNVVRNAAFSGPIAIISLLIRVYKMRYSDTFLLLKQAYQTYEVE